MCFQTCCPITTQFQPSSLCANFPQMSKSLKQETEYLLDFVQFVLVVLACSLVVINIMTESNLQKKGLFGLQVLITVHH